MIGSSAESATALASLASVLPGEVVELKASEKHTIGAKRERRPFWVQRGSLSDEKMLKIFFEFFEGKKFSQPTEGA